MHHVATRPHGPFQPFADSVMSNNFAPSVLRTSIPPFAVAGVICNICLRFQCFILCFRLNIFIEPLLNASVTLRLGIPCDIYFEVASIRLSPLVFCRVLHTTWRMPSCLRSHRLENAVQSSLLKQPTENIVTLLTLKSGDSSQRRLLRLF